MSTDKFELHYRLQLSALIDGDLSPDEARFLLRRLQHDGELNACWERWQLCGDVLRGQAQAPAPAGFAERVIAAIAAETQTVAAATPVARPRRALAKWGGGALAASVALIALFVARQQVPEENTEAPAVASQAPAVAPMQTPAASDAVATASVAAVAAASVPRKANRNNRGSATRNQQVARIANRAPQRERATGTQASTSAPVLVATAPPAHDPFRPAQAASEPAARPWPRSVLQQYPSASGGFNASYGNEHSTQAFYPFQPRLPQSPPVELPDPPQD